MAARERDEQKGTGPGAGRSGRGSTCTAAHRALKVGSGMQEDPVPPPGGR